jgi:hypothetical protein
MKICVEIWSYLRKKPKLICTLCDQVLIWDKEVYEYHIFSYIISHDVKTVAICVFPFASTETCLVSVLPFTAFNGVGVLNRVRFLDFFLGFLDFPFFGPRDFRAPVRLLLFLRAFLDFFLGFLDFLAFPDFFGLVLLRDLTYTPPGRNRPDLYILIDIATA